MKYVLGGARLKRLLDKVEPFVDAVQFLLSVTAVLLVCVTQFIPKELAGIPWLSLEWKDIQSWSQFITWSVFVGVFFAYGLTADRWRDYLREHWLEALICVCWMPFTGGLVLKQLHAFLSLQTLALVGSVAHVIRIARWAVKRFKAHPWVVIVAAAVVLVTTSSVVLMQIEPQTYTNMFDTAYFVVMTALTVGTDPHPVTVAGKIVAIFVSIAGIGLGAVLIGTVSKVLTEKLLPGHDETLKLAQHVEENNKLLQQLLEQQKKSPPSNPSIEGQLLAALLEERRQGNELHKRLLELLERQLPAGGHSSPPADDKPA